MAMFFILLGALFFVIGLYMAFSSLIVVKLSDALLALIGGALIMVAGYIQLDLGLMRRK